MRTNLALHTLGDLVTDKKVFSGGRSFDSQSSVLFCFVIVLLKSGFRPCWLLLKLRFLAFLSEKRTEFSLNFMPNFTVFMVTMVYQFSAYFQIVTLLRAAVRMPVNSSVSLTIVKRRSSLFWILKSQTWRPPVRSGMRDLGYYLFSPFSLRSLTKMWNLPIATLKARQFDEFFLHRMKV